MRKTTQKVIKDYVKLGIAKDVTTAKELPECYNRVCYSSGTYGMNGGVYEDKNGNMYAITARTTNLFRIF